MSKLFNYLWKHNKPTPPEIQEALSKHFWEF